MKKYFSFLLLPLLMLFIAAPVLAQKSAEAHLQRSIELFGEGKIDAAIAELDKAIKKKQDFTEAYSQRSILKMIKVDVDGALADASKAIQINPNLGQAYFQRAQIYMLKEDSQNALRDFDQAITRGYRTDMIYTQRAQLKMDNGNLDGAIADYTLAISLNPKSSAAYNGRSIAHMEQGNDQNALDDLNFVITEFEKNKGQEQLLTMRKIVVAGPIGPDKVEKAENGDEIVSRKVLVGFSSDASSPEEAELVLNISSAYLNRGVLHSRKGDADAAIADYTRAIEIFPSNFGAYSNRGHERQKRGDLEGALADYNEAVAVELGPQIESYKYRHRGILGPQMSYKYLDRGIVMLLLGKDAEAQKDFDFALKLEPSLKSEMDKRIAEAKKQRATKVQ